MLYACLLLYVSLIYIRPAEIVAEWATIPFIDILMAVSAVVALFSLALKPRPLLNLPQDKLLLAFWMLIALSTATVWLWLAYTSWLDFLPAVFCYFLIRASVTTERQLRGLIYLLVALNVFLAVNGIVQYHTGQGMGNVALRDGRIYGTGIFNDPNDLGMTFVMVVPLLLWMVGNRHARVILRTLSVVALAVVAIAIYYTNSRGTVVALGAALMWYSFQKFRPGPAFATAVLVAGLIAVAAPSRAGQMDFAEASAQNRIQSWSHGLTMFKMNPLLGVGYGQYTEHHHHVAHNSFVHTLAELGFLGGFCFAGMFYWFFKGLRVRTDENPSNISWRHALIASGVGVLVSIWFLSRQYVVVLYVLLALGACASVLSVQTGSHARHSIRMTSREVVRILGLTMLMIVIVYLSIRTMAMWSG